MVRRPPPQRINLPRSSENEKRDLCAEPPIPEERAALAARVDYEGYGKHKRNPYLWNLQPYHGDSVDRTYCEDAGFQIGDRPRIPQLLQRGVAAGLFGDLMSQGDPTMLWTIDDKAGSTSSGSPRPRKRSIMAIPFALPTPSRARSLYALASISKASIRDKELSNRS